MGNIYNKYPNAKGMIIQEAARMFIEEGYSNSSINRLSKNLKFSPGHITFYFPTKEHLLAVLVDEMFDYQRLMMEQEARDVGNLAPPPTCRVTWGEPPPFPSHRPFPAGW